jgi:hypothetical protein
MNRTEERLRAAVNAAGRTVSDGSAPPLRLPASPDAQPARPPYRRGSRVFLPLAAAAAVIAVLAVVAVVHAVSHGPGRPGGPVTSKRPQPVIPRFCVVMHLSRTLDVPYALVRETKTGRTIAKITVPPPYREFSSVVTGTNDDRAFVLAAGTGINRTREPVKFYRLTLRPTGRPGPLAALPMPALRQSIASFAVSPDGSKLAVAINHERKDRMVRPQILLYSMSTGALLRTWTWPGALWITSNATSYQQLLSWTDDGRTLAFEDWRAGAEQVRLLDITAPGTDLRAARLAVSWPHQAFQNWPFHNGRITDALAGYNALITGDGRQIVAGTDTIVKHPASDSLHYTAFSARTSQPVREILADPRPGQASGASVDVLWTSRTGDRLIVTRYRRGHAGFTKYLQVGVVHGNQFTPLPGNWPDIGGVAW